MCLATLFIHRDPKGSGPCVVHCHSLGGKRPSCAAFQALSVTSQFYTQDRWNCTKTLNKVLQEAYLGAFNNPGAISQILPSLVGKTYLDVRNLLCPTGRLSL